MPPGSMLAMSPRWLSDRIVDAWSKRLVFADQAVIASLDLSNMQRIQTIQSQDKWLVVEMILGCGCRIP